MKHIVLLILSLLITTTSFAQQKQRCGVVSYHNYLFSKYPQLKVAYDRFEQQVNDKVAKSDSITATYRTTATTTDTTTLHIIPIVVHVIHNNSNGAIGGTNISEAQILSQLTVINNDYRRLNADTSNIAAMFKGVAADMNFEFCMASRDPNGNATSGITRTYNAATSWDVTQDAQFKALSYWPSSEYLNIWVLPDITADGQSGILGYSQLPYGSLAGINSTDPGAATDGIAVMYSAYGDTGEVSFPYALGRTVTHEIGHWLGGLRHPWGDCNCCTDYVNDTPWQDSADYDYSPCSFRTSQCHGTKDTLMIGNFMQYTGDNCMNLFSNGQKQRSRVALYSCPRRVQLLSSLGCTAGNTTSTASTIAPVTNSDKFTIYPNPASSSYTISYQLANPEQVVLSVYNAEGMLVNTPINTLQQAGTYTTAFPTDNMAAGLYIFRFVNGNNAETRKVVIAK